MKKIKEGDTITLSLSGVPTKVTIKMIHFDGQINGQIDDDTFITFRMPNSELPNVDRPNRNVIKSFFSIGSDK